LVYSTEEIKSILNIFNSETEYDKRDLEEIGEFEYKLKRRGNYYVHSVHLRNLEPQTEYHFAIRNGIFLNSAEYINTFSTIREREEVGAPEVGYGNIYNQDGNLISDTLVFFELTNSDDTNKSQKVSYVMDGKTGWSVNLSNLMDSEFKEEYNQEEETYLGIYVINVNGEITKIVSNDKIRPAENISAYDNSYGKSDTDVKGVMAKLCECTTCTPTCPSGYSTTCPAGYNCTTTKATCTSRDACTGEVCGTKMGSTCYMKTTPKQTCTCESCTPVCSSGYSFTCPDGWNCATMNSACEKYDSCTGDRCGTQSGNTCYKPTTQKENCTCESCTPKCPEGFHMGTCKEGYNCGTAYSTCTQKDSCTGQRCGPLSIQGAICYKETTQKVPDPIPETPDPIVDTPESCVKRYEEYEPGRNQSFYWCNCNVDPSLSACVGALDLHNNYGSSCPKYCQIKKEEGLVKYSQCESKNLRERNGDLTTCEYGCQDNGSNSNDSCKPKPSEIPQEVNCTEFTDKTSCILDPSCTWDIKNRSCSYTPVAVITSCFGITSKAQCNSTENCEFVNGKCQEINLQNYIRGNEGAQYCTGLRDSNGDLIPIGYGTNSISTHQNLNKCSIDITALEINLGNQIPGSSYDSVTKKRVWKDGYKCEVGEYQSNGYGNNIIITQPDGTRIMYSHLKYADCDGIIQTGNSGNVPYHLHVEVMCSTPEECATCQGKNNPCRAIAGGCFNCKDSVKVQAISGEGNVNTKAKGKSSSLFSLISKIRAQEIEPIDPAILIQDLELPEGSYKVKSGSTSVTTGFVKTDSNHIVFYEDANDNGKLDTDEALISPYESQVEYQVSYEKVADSFKLSLQEGLNLVSFPIVFKDDNNEEIKKASKLIEYLNNHGTEITTITAYRGGKFLPYVIREGVGFGDDFNILPGEGYFVLSHNSGEFVFTGTKIKDSLEVQLYKGWNLVNIYNSNVKSYSGFDILKKMKEQSVGADVLSKWEDGMYTNIVSEQSGDYGTDFNVYQNRGYFVRVTGESGPFKPE
jgi:hypothetical protein